MPSFSRRFSRMTPGRVHRHEEEREAVVAGVRVGLRDEHDDVGAVAVGDVRLRAVDDVLVAVAHRARLDAGDVGAGVGLGDAEAEDLLALDRGHDPLLLLLLGAEREDRRHRHVGVDRDAHRQAAATARGRSPRRARATVVVAALAAVLLGLVEAEEARARPCAGRPSRGRSSPPTPRRAGASSFVAKARIDSRSCSCSSVKMKCGRLAPKSGLRTVSAAAMVGQYRNRSKVNSRTSYFPLGLEAT